MTYTKTSPDSMESELEKIIEDTNKPLSVCFVCTGNTCRSPMAEAVLNALGKGKYKAISAGLDAFEGDHITPYAVVALEKAGIESTDKNDYKHHKARMLDEETLVSSDIVIPMASGHMMRLICNFPKYAEKFMPLGKDIGDPFMQGQEVYDKCLSEITDALKLKFDI